MNSKKKLKKRILPFVALLLIVFIAVPGTMAYLIAQTPTLINVFKPLTKYISGTIIIEHGFDHPYGDDYVIPEDLSFTYTLDFENFMEGYEIETSAGNVVPDANGKVTLTVPATEPLTIYYVPAGVRLDVTRHPSPGFSLDEESVTQSISVARDATATLDFSSIYTPAPTNANTLTLSGEKSIYGKDWGATDIYIFAAEYKHADSDEWIRLGTVEVGIEDVNDLDKFILEGILVGSELSKAGDYNFRIFEERQEGISFYVDKSEKTFDVTVTDKDLDGVLEISDVRAGFGVTVKPNEENGTFDVSLEFSNITLPETDGYRENILVKNTVHFDDDDFISSDEFSFIITDTETGDTMILRSDKDGIVSFPLIFDEEDVGKTFEYTVAAVNDGIAGVTYSDEVYNVTVKVYRDPVGDIKTVISVNGIQVEKAELPFTTLYDPESASGGIYFWPVYMTAAMVGVSALSCTIVQLTVKLKAKKPKIK